MDMDSIRILSGAAVIAACSCSVAPPAPFGATPAPQQVEWQKMETNMFCHFGPNTFTSAEWGSGKESADVFSPSDLDCAQWVRTAKAAGMKGIIITAKHHDGFCLWPNPVSSHTVAQSSWRDGKGDVLAELSDACREYGLKFGVYISPWDRNDPTYGTPGYNDVFRQTLESALGNYGEVFEQWFDGACGEGPNGRRQVYDWPLYHETVYRMQPDAVIFSDIGPGCRWIGNEAGYAGKTCWSTLDVAGYEPGNGPSQDTLNCGNAMGEAWVPGEADVSIRPGWFYKESEDSLVKSLDDLLNIYYASVGRNSLLLLNVPPDKRGHIHQIDSLRLMEFRKALDTIFSSNLSSGASASSEEVRGGSRKYAADNILDGDYDTYWATDDGVTSASVTVSLDGPETFNRVMLQEYIPLGQRVTDFNIEALSVDGNWKVIAEGTTIGYKRILLTDMTTAVAVRINILNSHACPVLNGFGLFCDDILGDSAAWDDAAVTGDTYVASEPYILDLGDEKTVEGFYYEPMRKGVNGCIVCYDLEVSTDGKVWEKVLENRMFDNIVNNPIRQNVRFGAPVEARYIKIVPLRTNLADTYGMSGFGII